MSYNFLFTEYPDGFFKHLDYGIIELAEYTEGDIVDVDESGTGVITAVMTETFNFPTGDNENREVEASSDRPVYIIALESGMVAASGDNLSQGQFNTEKGDDEEDMRELANGAEEAAIYDKLDDPYSIEELVNIRGVDDPHVGFDSLPEGWTRKSVLQAWASLGGKFRTCRADMVGEIRNPTRFCAALKDEVLQTEMWRNKF